MTQEEFSNRYTYNVGADRIGGGGFGTVYKAKDNVLHRMVAIKVSEVKTTADGKKTFSLKDEFEALSHVPKHPNIANYEEFYSFGGLQGIFDFAVMQYYPDGNLSQAIKEGLNDKQKEEIALQLLQGISFLHEHNVVHRDLKPGNILIVRDGERIIPLITDFGLSKAAGMGDGSQFSNSFGGGTQRYSSPEQLQGKPLRFNTDLWSFGAIVYELFTGEQLFGQGSGASNSAQAELEVYNKIVHGDVQSLYKMPERWRKVAERCLVVNPDLRAKSVSELTSLLETGNVPLKSEETLLELEQQQVQQTTQNQLLVKPSSSAQIPVIEKYPGVKFTKHPKGGFVPKWFWWTLPIQLGAMFFSIGAMLVFFLVLYFVRRKPLKNCYVEETQNKYSRISDFYKLGLYNKRTMRLILPIEYDEISRLGTDMFLVEKDGKMGLIRGRQLIIPVEYDKIEINNDVFAAIKGSITHYYTKEGGVYTK